MRKKVKKNNPVCFKHKKGLKLFLGRIGISLLALNKSFKVIKYYSTQVDADGDVASNYYNEMRILAKSILDDLNIYYNSYHDIITGYNKLYNPVKRRAAYSKSKQYIKRVSRTNQEGTTKKKRTVIL